MNRSTGVGGDGGKQQGKGREEVDRGQPYAGRIPQQMRLLGCDCAAAKGWDGGGQRPRAKFWRIKVGGERPGDSGGRSTELGQAEGAAA